METTISPRRVLRWYMIAAAAASAGLVAAISLIWLFASSATFDNTLSIIGYLMDEKFLLFTGVGFIAQLIDGALGMAYGVTSTSFLMGAGVSPVAASASVHMAEIFTTGASGLSHWRFGNVNKKIFIRLAIPGAVGAAIGAYVLTTFDGEEIKPVIAAYLLVMGVIIIIKAFRKVVAFRERKRISWLALLGGFVDSSGGGGWGPVVSSTLIGSGHHPRFTIGTVNASEFFIALTASGIFTLFIGLNNWIVICGLIMGGMIAAPIGAFVTHRINHRVSMVIVGLLIIALSIRTIILSV